MSNESPTPQIARSPTTRGEGSARLLPDVGGPDSRPDLYISRFAPGTLGVAFPGVNAAGGAFAVVSNNLDPSAERSFASLYATVAHELFHLVQFSYFGRDSEPTIPTWILEGTASGIEGSVYPELDDIVTSLQLRRWFSAPQVSITTQSYGAQLLWRHLDLEEPRLLPALFQRLATRPGPGDGEGVHLVRSTFAQVSGTPFAAAFRRFAVSVATDDAAEIKPLFTLPRARRAAPSSHQWPSTTSASCFPGPAVVRSSSGSRTGAARGRRR